MTVDTGDQYWAQWSPLAHRRYQAIMREIDPDLSPAGGLRWTPAAPVPTWLRRATDGILLPPEAPTLQIARCWDPVDWPVLVGDHREDLIVAGPVGPDGPSWKHILQAWTLLGAAGHDPALDVDLEVSVDGYMLELRHGGLGTTSGRLVSDAVLDQITGVLGQACEVEWPVSDLQVVPHSEFPPTPLSPSQPSRTNNSVWWSWLSADVGDFTDPRDEVIHWILPPAHSWGPGNGGQF